MTTKLLRRIAEAAGSQMIDDLLVGFKYVAEVIMRLEQEGATAASPAPAEDLVLAAEESHGLMPYPASATRTRYRPASVSPGSISACASEGRTILDYYIAILDELGGQPRRRAAPS